MSTLQSLDITRRSATTSPSPSVRETEEVAKLIDISKMHWLQGSNELSACQSQRHFGRVWLAQMASAGTGDRGGLGGLS